MVRRPDMRRCGGRRPFVVTDAHRDRVRVECRRLIDAGTCPKAERLKAALPDIPCNHIESIRRDLIRGGLIDMEDVAPKVGLTARNKEEIAERFEEERKKRGEILECEAKRRLNSTPVPTVCDRAPGRHFQRH
jgi:hypothetical protein